MSVSLNIEAENLSELVQKTLVALGLTAAQAGIQPDPVAAVEAALDTPPPEEPPKRTLAEAAFDTRPPEAPPKRARAKKAAPPPPTLDADGEPVVADLMARFKVLVAADYDKAALILDELGVETFAEIVAGDLTRELAAKLVTAEA